MSDLAFSESELSSSIGNFADLVAAGTPSPGGGSVAAYCGVLAASLGQMVCSLSIGKKKYVEVEPRLLTLRQDLERLDSRLRELILEDAASFESVLASYRLAKDTEEQKSVRTKSIQRALEHAIAVPLETARRSMEVLIFLEEIAEIGNRNALSDAAVGAQLAQTAVKGASYNVAINLDSISDRESAEKVRQQIDRMIEDSRVIADKVNEKFQTRSE